MSGDESACDCVIDCAGLHEIASTRSDNLKRLFFDRLSSGRIAVPALVWREFKELYEEEADEIEPHVATKITMKRAYHAGAARIADNRNSGFSRGPYDSESDLYTASIASLEGYVVLTSASQVRHYDGMDCEVSDLTNWAEQQG
jgi:hypothetical protein